MHNIVERHLMKKIITFDIIRFFEVMDRSIILFDNFADWIREHVRTGTHYSHAWKPPHNRVVKKMKDENPAKRSPRVEFKNVLFMPLVWVAHTLETQSEIGLLNGVWTIPMWNDGNSLRLLKVWINGTKHVLALIKYNE